MHRNFYTVWSVVLSVITSFSSPAWATPWNLPVSLQSENTTVKFEVKTTWHTVHGIVRNISGKAWLKNVNDPKSINVEIAIPVLAMDTDNTSRDEEMKNAMNSDQFPAVHLSIQDIPEICDPESVTLEKPCFFSAKVNLTIRDVSREVLLRSSVHLNASREYEVSGTTSFKWSDFGVRDPSIFIAKVHEEVMVQFSVKLPYHP